MRNQLFNAIEELGFEQLTPIQSESYSTILSGKDFVGIAQTGTGKTIAYLLPILQDLKFSDQANPRVLILVPTRELVIQVVQQINALTTYLSVRTVGVYGGTNIKTQKKAIHEGIDIIVGTPRRLYDLALTNVLRLQDIKKLVIDEVDIMLDFGYKTQLRNIFEYLPQKRQNILFSATMTTYVDELISGFLVNPIRKTMAVSGTPLETISQECYSAANFYTKTNLLNYLLRDKDKHHKVLIFMGSKINADRLHEHIDFPNETSVIHSSKEQNHRSNSIERFATGESRILIATDVIARGIDIEGISTVISFNTPHYPENYIHRIGRTGRAEREGQAILFFNEKESPLKEAIEGLMSYKIPEMAFPSEVQRTTQLTPEEKRKPVYEPQQNHKKIDIEAGPAFHEKKEKNKKENAKVKKYHRELKAKYKKPKTRGDKLQNRKKKKKR